MDYDPLHSGAIEEVKSWSQDGKSANGWQKVGDWFSGLGNNISNWWNSSSNWLNPGNWQKKAREIVGLEIPNSASSESKIAYTDSGLPYDSSNVDSQINALAQEYAYKRDDEAYDRLFAALKRNGINPALFMDNASAFSSSTAAKSNYNIDAKDQLNSALKVGMIIAMIMRFMK